MATEPMEFNVYRKVWHANRDCMTTSMTGFQNTYRRYRRPLDDIDVLASLCTKEGCYNDLLAQRDSRTQMESAFEKVDELLTAGAPQLGDHALVGARWYRDAAARRMKPFALSLPKPPSVDHREVFRRRIASVYDTHPQASSPSLRDRWVGLVSEREFEQFRFVEALRESARVRVTFDSGWGQAHSLIYTAFVSSSVTPQGLVDNVHISTGGVLMLEGIHPYQTSGVMPLEHAMALQSRALWQGTRHHPHISSVAIEPLGDVGRAARALGLLSPSSRRSPQDPLAPRTAPLWRGAVVAA